MSNAERTARLYRQLIGAMSQSVYQAALAQGVTEESARSLCRTAKNEGRRWFSEHERAVFDAARRAYDPKAIVSRTRAERARRLEDMALTTGPVSEAIGSAVSPLPGGREGAA